MAVEIKICGLTDPADAAVAVAAGASYLGVVFAGGPRRIDAARARSIVAVAGRVPVFAVVGDVTTQDVLDLVKATGLRGIQLHGSHEESTAASLRQSGLMVWEVARLASIADLERLDAMAQRSNGVLVEPKVEGVQGGAGVALGLSLATGARRRLAGQRMILAGGLTPDTVAAAIDAVNPDVVDVSSGVEFQPGRKDPERIIRFVEAVVGHHSPS